VQIREKVRGSAVSLALDRLATPSFDQRRRPETLPYRDCDVRLTRAAIPETSSLCRVQEMALPRWGRVAVAFGGRPRTAAAVHGRIVSWGRFDGEKTWAVTNRAGDGPRDRRQAIFDFCNNIGQEPTLLSIVSHSGSPAFRNPSSYLARSSGRRNGSIRLRSETRSAGSIWRSRAMALCA
jgi:hypothetical protein